VDIKQILLKEHNKKTTLAIVAYVGDDAERFKELMQCFLGDEMRLSQRASWPLGFIGEERPHLLKPYHKVLIESLQQEQKHNAIKRNVTRIYQSAPIPEKYEAQLYDICAAFLMDPNEAIAARAFGLRVCERVVEKYPEMANEINEIIKANMEHWSSGLKSRGSKFLKRWD